MQESNRPTRRWFAFAALGLAACRESAPPADPFPETVAGVWRRIAMADLPVSEAPDPVPRSSVRRLRTAVYEGPGRVEARAYELDSSAVGLDLAQRWRPSADTVFFNAGRYFVVVKWQQADRQALQDLVRAIERRLAPGGR